LLGERRGLAIILSTLVFVSIVLLSIALIDMRCYRADSGSVVVFRDVGRSIYSVYISSDRAVFLDYISALNSSLSVYSMVSIAGYGLYDGGGSRLFYVVFRDRGRYIVFTYPSS
jgi:hypothetical protein